MIRIKYTEDSPQMDGFLSKYILIKCDKRKTFFKERFFVFIY